MDVKNVTSANIIAVSPQRAAPVVASKNSDVSTPSTQSLNAVRHISQSTQLNESQKESLINLAVKTEQFINPTQRDSMLKNVVGLGVFLEQGATGEFPRWELLTGLRYYAGKRIELPHPPGTEEQVMSRIQQGVAELAATSIGIDATALAQTFSQPAPAIQAQANKVVTEGSSDNTANNSPAPTTNITA